MYLAQRRAPVGVVELGLGGVCAEASVELSEAGRRGCWFQASACVFGFPSWGLARWWRERMAHSGELTVIYSFDIGYGRDAGYVKLEDWHTKLGLQLRETICAKSKHLFERYGIYTSITSWLWNEGDEQPIDLRKYLVDIFAVDAKLVEVFLTRPGATAYDEPLSSRSTYA